MPIINGVKYACEPCMRGHRSSKCTHGDRILVRVRKPGRPLSSCPHETNTCSCDVTRVAIPKVSSCKCGTSSSKFNESAESNKRRKAVGQSASSERRAAAAAKSLKEDVEVDSEIDPALKGESCCGGGNINGNAVVEQPKPSGSCCNPRPEAITKRESNAANGNHALDGNLQSPVSANGNVGRGNIYVQNRLYQDPQGNFVRPQNYSRRSSGPGMNSPQWNLVATQHSTMTEFHLPGRERYSSQDEKGAPIMVTGSMNSVMLHGHDQADSSGAMPHKQMGQRYPFQEFSQPGYQVMSPNNYFPGSVQTHVENVQFMNSNMTTPTQEQNGGTPQNGFFSGQQEYNPAHECHCGPTCNCLGCVTHPFNKKTIDYVRSMREALGGMSYPGSEDVDSSSSRLSSPHILPNSGLHISSPTSSTFKEQVLAEGTSQMPTLNEEEYSASRRQSSAQQGQILEDGISAPASEFFHIDYRLGSCSEGNNCHCGEGCTCVGCLTHGGHNGVNLSPEGINQVLNGQLETRFSES